MCKSFKIIENPPSIEGKLRIRYNPYLHEQFKIGYPLLLTKSKEIPFSNVFFAKEIIATDSKTYLLTPKIENPEVQTTSNKVNKT